MRSGHGVGCHATTRQTFARTLTNADGQNPGEIRRSRSAATRTGLSRSDTFQPLGSPRSTGGPRKGSLYRTRISSASRCKRDVPAPACPRVGRGSLADHVGGQIRRAASGSPRRRSSRLPGSNPWGGSPWTGTCRGGAVVVHDGVEQQGRHPQRGDVVELLDHSLEVASPEAPLVAAAVLCRNRLSITLFL